ncbi:hypothetical protein V6N11_030702 [Hibiscus sabdariffa]|uniref:Uncharacterized protein n=1 Tax=Hibiscus sabdariffa TaxID=183260 RepID=A0ABR2NBH4_9ROSI
MKTLYLPFCFLPFRNSTPSYFCINVQDPVKFCSSVTSNVWRSPLVGQRRSSRRAWSERNGRRRGEVGWKLGLRVFRRGWFRCIFTSLYQIHCPKRVSRFDHGIPQRPEGRGSKGLGEDGFMTIIVSHAQPFAFFHQLSQRVVSPIGFGTNGEEKLMVVSKTYLGGDQRKWTILPMESRELWKVVHVIFFYFELGSVPSLRIVPEPAEIIAELSTISISEAIEPVNADDPLKDHLRPK